MCQSRGVVLCTEAWKTHVVKVSLLLPLPTHHWTCSQLSESHAGTGPGTWEPQSRGSRAEPSPPGPAPSSLQPCLIPCTGRQGLLPRSFAAAVPFTCPAAHTCVSSLQSHTQLSFGPLWVFSDVSDRVRRAFHGIPHRMACAPCGTIMASLKSGHLQVLSANRSLPGSPGRLLARCGKQQGGGLWALAVPGQVG